MMCLAFPSPHVTIETVADQNACAADKAACRNFQSPRRSPISSSTLFPRDDLDKAKSASPGDGVK